tara:strand:+ start:733 stop:1377 length:645 start_codon:yes stop_codon:yes gene_type:complete
MQIKINKEGKKTNYNLIKSWDEVTLDKWVKLISRREKTKTQDALDTISVLSDIPKKIIKELALGDVAKLLKKIADLQGKEDTKLKKIIKLDGIEYGFHPNLEEITLGEYADIETYLKNGLEDNLTKLVAVLYRPITEKEGEHYSIEAYGISDTRLRAKKFEKMKARDVNSSLVFFWTLGKKLSKCLLPFLMEQSQTILEKMQENNLQTSGDGLE